METQKQEIENIKIGVIDSGFDPRFSVFLLNQESEGSDWKNLNLQDTKIEKITSRKNGHEGHNSKNSITLDKKGHGTKCASVAAATAPSVRLYLYKVSKDKKKGFDLKDIAYAFDAAIKDKVDVISISFGVGIPSSSNPYCTDAIAAGSFRAMQSDILTVAAGGNEGPSYKTIRNVAPWLLTVGASESNEKFEATVEIGSKKFVGSSLNSSDIECPLHIFPPILKSSKKRDIKSQDTHKRKRIEGPLKGYIVLCSDLEEMYLAKMAGAEGILYHDSIQTFARDDKNFPSVWLAEDDVKEIHQLIRKNTNRGTPIKAKICISRMVDNPNAFTVAKFSGRGPNPTTKEILKPDICTTGVEICVASVNPMKNDEYMIASGTSYACPRVAVAAALIKQKLEKSSLKASPAMIKSALMTAAYNPQKKCSIFAKGAGFLNFEKAMNPGLVYNCGADDYVNHVNCFREEERNKRKPWELNYPSIMVKVPKDGSKYSFEIPRRLTYVGTTSEVYKARITDRSHTAGIKFKIEPSTLHFNGPNCEKNFKVILNIDKEDWTKTPKLYTAHLEWSPQTNKNQCVKIPIGII